MNSIGGIIIVILIIIYVTHKSGMYASNNEIKVKVNEPDQSTETMYGGHRYYDINAHDLLCAENKTYCSGTHAHKHTHPKSYGLREIEQGTSSRGHVPYANQPDHTANLWKTDPSHCDQDTLLVRNEYQSDFTPQRNKYTNFDVAGASNMHLTSRFVAESS